jgi:hypothetical protein
MMMKKTIYTLFFLLCNVVNFAQQDVVAPTVPTNLRIESLDHNHVTVVWDVSTDAESGIKGYPISTWQTQRGDSDKYATTNSYTINFDASHWSLDGQYFMLAVQAQDNAGNWGEISTAIRIDIPPAIDSTPPTIPSNLRIISLDHYHVKVAWDSSFDAESGIKGYPISTWQTQRGDSDKYATTNSYTINFDASHWSLDGQYFMLAVQAQDNAGNWSGISNAIRIDIPPLPSSNFTITLEVQNNRCYGDYLEEGAIAVKLSNGKAPYTISLKKGDIIISSDIINNTVKTYTSLRSGNYTILASDSNNISYSYDIIITSPTLPIDATVEVVEKTATINATGGVPPYEFGIYYFNENIINPVIFYSSNVFTNLVPGSYFVNIKDSLGCTLGYPFTIRDTPNNPFKIIPIVQNPICFRDYNGKIQITLEGGTAPFNCSLQRTTDNKPRYESLINTNFVSYNSLEAGDYIFVVKDASGLTSTLTIGVEQPKEFYSKVILSNNIYTIEANGGAPPYAYQLDNQPPTASNTFTLVVPGTYSLSAIDSKGCYTVNTITVEDPNEPFTFNTTLVDRGCGDIQINCEPKGGKKPYLLNIIKLRPNGSVDFYYWKDYQIITNTLFGYFSTGKWKITCTDSNNKTEERIIDVKTNALSYLNGFSGNRLSATIVGGTPPYKYSLDNGLTYQNGDYFTYDLDKKFEALLEDSAGCKASLYYTPPPKSKSLVSKVKQYFPEGATLEDVKLEGENIKWYNNKPIAEPAKAAPIVQQDFEGKNLVSARKLESSSKSSIETLPLTTVLEDGKAYYATQTIDGIESESFELVVTQNQLELEGFELATAKVFPNPVVDRVSINYANPISEVQIFSQMGVQLKKINPNTNQVEMDLSDYKSGIYLLKIVAEGYEKTMKIIKQ